jgi:hypothetical protein
MMGQHGKESYQVGGFLYLRFVEGGFYDQTSFAFCIVEFTEGFIVNK